MLLLSSYLEVRVGTMSQILPVFLWKLNASSVLFDSAELGDYREAENPPSYLSEFCFIPNQPQGFEKEVAKHHQQHRLVRVSVDFYLFIAYWCSFPVLELDLLSADPVPWLRTLSLLCCARHPFIHRLHASERLTSSRELALFSRLLLFLSVSFTSAAD